MFIKPGSYKFTKGNNAYSGDNTLTDHNGEILATVSDERRRGAVEFFREAGDWQETACIWIDTYSDLDIRSKYTYVLSANKGALPYNYFCATHSFFLGITLFSIIHSTPCLDVFC